METICSCPTVERSDGCPMPPYAPPFSREVESPCGTAVEAATFVVPPPPAPVPEEPEPPVAQRPPATRVRAVPALELFEEAPATLDGAPVWKRVLDLTLLFLSSPVWLPLGLLVAAAIKLISR